MGIYLGFNQVVFQKLLKVVNYHFLEKSKEKKINEFAFMFAGDFFLPALCARENQNLILDDLLWNIFKEMDYKLRYQYYFKLLSSGYVTNFQLL